MKVTIDISDSVLELIPSELHDEAHMAELLTAFFKASLFQVSTVPKSVRKKFLSSFLRQG